MNSDKTLNPETLETQIVVIGGGGAGLVAAVNAAEKGADVTLIEKQDKPGGATQMAYGLFGAGSPLHKRMNIEVDKDEFFRIAMDYAHWVNDPRLVRAYIDISGDTIRWLEEKGVTFNLSSVTRTYGGKETPPVRHDPKGYCAEVVKALIKSCEDLGVRVLCGTAAKELLTRDKKGVTGALAKRKSGEEIVIKANCVIIATGGYGGNRELLRKWCPYYKENWQYIGWPNVGDGVLMATKIGAATDNLGAVFTGPKGDEKGEPSRAREPRAMWILKMLNESIWVNKKGERFADESSYHARGQGFNAITRQPDQINYTLFDEGILQSFIEEQATTTDHYRTLTELRPELMGLEEAHRMLQKRAGDRVKIADSWDEMANWMGITPEALEATIDEYNSFCDKGHDDTFLKDPRYLIALRTPPYYALRCVPRYQGTLGGIRINYKTEALDHEYNPIPGLYAAGEGTSGYHGECYNILLNGSQVGFAINSGRIAGENAAKYVSGKL